ncbi:MAG: flagellar hook-associated protein FlgK [Bdellovibrionaceae bacterium]|nr:flagellar hook-associated protein FlgK [Pseudobdellovibrionaceae bacterium]MDW8190656.1 flagellar hook-associated protein FlgK [Pseudobdellovibrionaceae bacterium]
MGKINTMMDIGKRSMMNSQTALQTVSHNIANRTTEGYSRQRVDLQAAAPVTEGRLQIGMGARAAQVTRTNNPFLEKQLQRESSHKSYLDGQAELLSRVEQVFNEQSVKGLNQYISDFFNAFRELANTPESMTARALVRESAELMAQDFGRVMKQLEDIQQDVDFQLMGRSEEINRILEEIASLNQKIVEIEMRQIAANDQKDRRDLLVKKLGELLDIRVAEGDRGAITIMTSGNGILVSGNEAGRVEARLSPQQGKMTLFLTPAGSQTELEIGSRIQGGLLGGILHIRDQVLEEMKQSINLLAFTIVDQVNEAHLQGVTRRGEPASFFFEPVDPTAPVAKNMKLHSLIKNDLNQIAAGVDPKAPGDASVAHVISQIQTRQIFDQGTATVDDFYNSQVGRIGILTQRALKASQSQGEVVQQLTKLRESISGVNLDEEATKMIEFQKAFDASARLIRTADEMLETVLNLKRL